MADSLASPRLKSDKVFVTEAYTMLVLDNICTAVGP